MMEREQSGEEWEGLGLEYRQGSIATIYKLNLLQIK
jgi:hypothetical protein